MARIYTRSGDTGTSLIGTARLPKSSIVFHFLGALDELNAHVGLAICSAILDLPNARLKDIPASLLCIGAYIHTGSLMLPLNAVQTLEDLIDEIDGQLPELHNFILPVGCAEACNFFVAATVCRRAERSFVELLTSDEDDRRVASYLNRLSDLLFVLARYCNMKHCVSESTWNTVKTD